MSRVVDHLPKPKTIPIEELEMEIQLYARELRAIDTLSVYSSPSSDAVERAMQQITMVANSVVTDDMEQAFTVEELAYDVPHTVFVTLLKAVNKVNGKEDGPEGEA